MHFKSLHFHSFIQGGLKNAKLREHWRKRW